MLSIEKRVAFGLPLMQPVQPMRLMVAPAGLLPVECELPTSAKQALEILTKCVEEVPSASLEVDMADEDYVRFWVRGYREPTPDELAELAEQTRQRNADRKEAAQRVLRELG